MHQEAPHVGNASSISAMSLNFIRDAAAGRPASASTDRESALKLVRALLRQKDEAAALHEPSDVSPMGDAFPKLHEGPSLARRQSQKDRGRVT